MNDKTKEQVKDIIAEFLSNHVVTCPVCRHKTLGIPPTYWLIGGERDRACMPGDVLCLGCGHRLRHRHVWEDVWIEVKELKPSRKTTARTS